MEHQIYRSLYEFMYAYEQIERERVKRFGRSTDRKAQFEYLLREALKGDEVVSLRRRADSLELDHRQHSRRGEADQGVHDPGLVMMGLHKGEPDGVARGQ